MNPGTRLGPYEILSPLGAGGMGEVYRARDTRLGREVAVKVLPEAFARDPDRLARFEREARAAAALSHPNILVLHDVGTHEGTPYIVTELLEGETLRARLGGSGALPPARAVEIGVQIAQGLSAAHEKGIVHRDLKPDNLFLTRDGRVKILDFGLARLSHPEPPPEPPGTDTPTRDSPSVEGEVAGTVGYMAPEQVRGRPADPRSDIFALGTVLYEMLSGRRPFEGDSGPDIQAAILKEEPPPLPGCVSPALGAVVLRCLEKRPEERFQSVRDACFALQSAASAPPSRPAPPARPPLSRRWAWGLGAAALLALISGGVAWIALGLSAGDALPPSHPRRVTSLPGAESEPAAAPDGTQVAFTRTQEGNTDIWVTDARGGTPLRLTDRPAKDERPVWFPDGAALAFVSDQGGTPSIWSVQRFGGTPMLLVPDATDPAVSPDGRQIAFSRPGPDGYARIWVAPLSEVARAKRLTGDDGGIFTHARPAWSPDGATLCYQAQRGLWLVPAGGGAARPFTRDDEADSDPAWSPDGHHIYFGSFRDGTQALWRQVVNGGPAVRVTLGTGPEAWPSLSKDGRVLAYTTYSDRSTLLLIDRSSGERIPLQDAPLMMEPALAPDGSALVYVSDGAGTYDLWRQPLEAGRPRGAPQRLTALPGTCAHPAVSPDGRWIAFFRAVEGQRDVWIVAASGGAPERFTSAGTVNVQAEWSPEGRELAFVSNRGGAQELWVAPVSEGRPAGEPRRIVTPEGAVTSPSWSPDGRRLAYLLSRAAGGEVWVSELTGAHPPRLLAQDSDPLVLTWDRATGKLLVSGFFGKPDRAIWEVPLDGGTPMPLAAARASGPDRELFAFAPSTDGKLLVLQEWDTRGDIWVLESQKGTF